MEVERLPVVKAIDEPQRAMDEEAAMFWSQNVQEANLQARSAASAATAAEEERSHASQEHVLKLLSTKRAEVFPREYFDDLIEMVEAMPELLDEIEARQTTRRFLDRERIRKTASDTRSRRACLFRPPTVFRRTPFARLRVSRGFFAGVWERRSPRSVPETRPPSRCTARWGGR